MTPWFATCSDAYRPLLEQHFLPSFESSGLSKHYDLHVLPLGEGLTHLAVMEILLAALPRDKLSVASGVDFRFYDDFNAVMMLRDDTFFAATSMDAPDIHCPDFIISSGKPLFFDFCADWLSEARRGKEDDQVVMNWVNDWRLNSLHKLPNQFWTIGLTPPLDRYPWQKGDRVPEPPEDIVLHHSNYVAAGVENKLALLEAVRLKVQN